MPPSGSEAAGGSTRSVSRYAAHAAQAAGRRHLPASVTHKVTLPTEGWSGKCILPPGTARAAISPPSEFLATCGGLELKDSCPALAGQRPNPLIPATTWWQNDEVGFATKVARNWPSVAANYLIYPRGKLNRRRHTIMLPPNLWPRSGL